MIVEKEPSTDDTDYADEYQGQESVISVQSVDWPREVLIDAARMKARGAEWEAVAEKTGADVGELVTFSIDHPEVWGPLSERAEKLRLQEAEGETIKGLCTLLKGDDETAAENAAKELLIHRRHVERRRYSPPRHQEHQEELESCSAAGEEGCRLPERGLVPPTGGESLAQTTPGGRNLTICQGGQKPSFGNATHALERWYADDPPPEEIVRRITYAAHRVAHGDDYHRIARETGQPEADVARWAFIYARAWDRAYPTARRTAAQAGAARAINRLLDFVVGFDPKLAARAGRMLLVHRRHMHWGNANQAQDREVENVGEGAGTYPSSMTQGLVAIHGDGSLTVARRSGPARSCGTVRPSASRARDGPG